MNCHRIQCAILLILLFGSCCKTTDDYYSPQKITYRLSVYDLGTRLCFDFDSCAYVALKPGIYDTNFYREINEQCTFCVRASCDDEQKLSFLMQILRNDVEVKSKSYTRVNLCGEVNLSMTYMIVP